MAWFLWARNCLQRNDNDKEMTHEQTAMASSWMELLPCWDRLASTTYSNEESTVATDKCNKERVLIRWACREVKVKVLVTQLCPTLRDPMDCSPPGFSIQGILQARIREWVAISFSRGIFPTQGSKRFSHTAGRLFTVWATREALVLKTTMNEIDVLWV